MPELTLLQWIIGTCSAYLVGVAKTGVPGLGILVVPLMVLAVGDAKQSAGWLLPILCLADIFAVIYWRRHAAASRLFSLLPWVVCGMMLGSFALTLPERTLRYIVGAILFAMLSTYVYRRWLLSENDIPSHGPTYGITAGFATTVANAAGPVMNLYLLAQRLPKEEFIATGAWFFLAINFSKIPIYAYHGLFSSRSLGFNLYMIPAVIAGAVSGRWLVHRIPAKLFETLVLVLTAVSTLLLLR